MKSRGTSNTLGKRKLQHRHDSEDDRQEQLTPNTNAGDERSDSEQSSDDSDDYDAQRKHDRDEEEEEEFKLDRKDLLIVKDGTIRVAESLDEQQFDANGEAIKASGTWTQAEHDRFLKAMETYPKGPWKSIAAIVGSRTVRQTQTHAQKYREKIARRMRGLRNRNGTLQYPVQSHPRPSSVVYDYSEYALPQRGSVANNHDRMPIVYHHHHHPAHIYVDRHHQFPHHVHVNQHLPYPPAHMHHAQHVVFHHHQQQQQQQQQLPTGIVVSAPLPTMSMPSHAAPVAVSSSSSMEFNQLSKLSISSAFLGNSAYSASWDPRQQPSAAVSLAAPPALARGASWPLSSSMSSSSSSSPFFSTSSEANAVGTETATSQLTASSSSTARRAATETGTSSTASAAGATTATASARVARTSRRGSDGKEPNFDESMDFLMDVFSGHPSPLSGTQVASTTATAAAARGVGTGIVSSDVHNKRSQRSQSQSPPQQRRRH